MSDGRIVMSGFVVFALVIASAAWVNARREAHEAHTKQLAAAIVAANAQCVFNDDLVCPNVPQMCKELKAHDEAAWVKAYNCN
jgi:hypothetical protein